MTLRKAPLIGGFLFLICYDKDMRKLIMWNVVSLDGFFEGSKAWDLDFHQLVYDKELEAISIEQLQSAEMLVFGRKTYLGMAEYWKDAEGQPEAPYMNKLPKVVCSTTLDNADWNNTVLVKDAAHEISNLKQQGDGIMFVFGSAELSKSLIAAGLFDEYRLCVAPVLLAEGKRLFSNGTPYQKLRLLADRRLQNGGVILTYAPHSK